MRILLVEDDAVIASSLSKGLREEAYAKRDGFAVCRELRQRGLTWTAERA